MRVLDRAKKVLELVHLGRPDQATTGRGNPYQDESPSGGQEHGT